MSEYTPTTEEVRDSYDYQFTLGMSEISRIAEFDRWLASVKAEAWEEGWDEGCEYGWSGTGKPKIENPYSEETE